LGKKYWEAMKPGSGPLYEGLPIVLLKAMGFGNCVLAVDVPYNVEVVGDAGIPFSKHGDDLTNKLQDLIDNPYPFQLKATLGNFSNHRLRRLHG